MDDKKEKPVAMFFGTEEEKKSKGHEGHQFWVAITREHVNFFLIWLFKQNFCLHREVNPQTSESGPDSAYFYIRFLWTSSEHGDHFFELFEEFCKKNGMEAQDKRTGKNIEEQAMEFAAQ